MARPTRESAIERFALAVLVGTAVGGFASTYRTQPAWLLEVPCAISLFWRMQHFPQRLRVWTRNFAYALLGGTALRGLIFMAYPVLSNETATGLTLIPGYGLAFFSTLFLLGTRVWSPASALFPATLGTLVAVCFQPAAPLRGIIALAGTAAFAYLAVQTVTAGRQVFRLVVSGLGIFLVAWLIIRLLPWAQVRVEQAAPLFFSSGSTHYSSLSLSSRLGDLEELKLSTKVVMRLWTTRPQKLRGRIFTQFDGQGWRARGGLAGKPLSPAPPGSPVGESLGAWLDTIPGSLFILPGHDIRQAVWSDAIRTKMVQTVFNDGLLVAPGQTLLVRVPLNILSLNAFENLAPPVGSATEIYGLINRRQGDIVQVDPGSAEIHRECLLVPEDTDGRLRELAARLAAQSPSPEERLRRTVDFVQNACRYSLKMGPFHSRQPMAEFLFEKKQGYCQYFASAAAVLLRLEGVPSRYVTGFNVQEGNRLGSHYVVRESDAHAWIEAYLPDRGWMEADPTPEAEYQALHANLKGGPLERAAEWMKAELAEAAAWVHQGDWLAADRWLWRQVKKVGPGLLGVAVFVGMMWLLWRRRRVRLPQLRRDEDAQTSPELAALLSRLDALWARQGLARPACRAPLEHLAGIPPERISPALREASRKAIEYFYQACFGGAAADPARIQELQRSLEP